MTKVATGGMLTTPRAPQTIWQGNMAHLARDALKGVRKKEISLGRTLKSGWCKTLGLECTAKIHKVSSALLLLDAIVKWSFIDVNALN